MPARMRENVTVLRHYFWRSILFISQYYESVKKIIDLVYQLEGEKIKHAGVCAADAIEGGGLIHVFGCGHSHMVGEEIPCLKKAQCFIREQEKVPGLSE